MAQRGDPLELRVPGRTVAEVIAQLQDAGRHDRGRDFRAVCRDDGRVRAHQPAARAQPPVLVGELQQDGPDVVLAGELRESLGARVVAALFVVLTVFMAAVAVLLVVVGGAGDVTGIAVCGVSAVAFLGVVLMGRWVRRTARPAELVAYRAALAGRLGVEEPPTADRPASVDPRAARATLALFERLDGGVPFAGCAAEAGTLAGLLVDEGLSRGDARTAVEALAAEFVRSSGEERGEVLHRLRSGS
jgi:hypothetical protein